MKGRIVQLLSLVLLLLLTSWTHKFYVGIFQLNHNAEKKMLEVTCRIFVDDLNEALEKKHKKKFHFAESEGVPGEIEIMAHYLTSNFYIVINGQKQLLDYRSYKIENNVLIAYCRVTKVGSIQTLDITNRILFDHLAEQQNIIQVTNKGIKKNLLLTIDQPSGKLAF